MKKALTMGLPLALLTTATVGQTTHVVGPGGFPQVNAALAVAAPGDVILVQPGAYNGFLSTIGVTVRGTAPGVFLGPNTATLPAGQTLHLIGVQSTAIQPSTITGGNAVFDSCILSGYRVQSCNAHFQSCTVRALNFLAASPGLTATNSYVTAIDCTFTGASGDWNGPLPIESIRLQDSTFHGSHLSATGGSHAGLGVSPTAAIEATNSVVWISDSNLTAGTAWTGTACAVDAQFGLLSRCVLSPNCAGAIPTSGPLLGMHRPNPLQSPGPFSLEFTTDPNGLVGVYFATGLGNLAIPGLEQPLLLEVATTFHLELLVANATGFASGTWNVPAGLTNQTFFFQAVGTAAAPSLLQMSPVAGGIVN